jgi:hypothetical protein
MTDNDGEWLTVEAVASRLRVSVRHASRFQGRVKTKKAGKRILFHRDDIEALAREIGADNKPLLPAPVELVPIGEMLEIYERQHHELAAAREELGQLRGVLQGQQPMIEGYQALQARVIELERAQARLETELAAAQRRPWWRRLLDR